MKRFVDFDGTLAYFDGWKGFDHTGEPIPLMVKKVKGYLKDGDVVTIYTARLTMSEEYGEFDPKKVVQTIEEWCIKHIGVKPPITNIKGAADFFEDDRGVRIVRNTGLTMGEFLSTIIESELEQKDVTKEESLNKILGIIKIIEKEI